MVAGRRRHVAPLACLFWLTIAGVACAPAAESGCPDGLRAAVGYDDIACTLLADGRLVSSRGNPDLAYQLYRWASPDDDVEESPYDEPPYNQVAVSLHVAGKPDELVWIGHYWLGVGWFEAPFLAENATHGEFLVVPGRYTGTGAFVEDHVFLGNGANGWRRIAGTQLDPETTEGWLAGLDAHLPEGHYLAKGILIDYARLAGESAVWRRDDANCCPSGGTVRFRLTLQDPSQGFALAEVDYEPPSPTPR